MSNKEKIGKDVEQSIKDEIQLTNPEVIPIIFHQKKEEILKLLVNKEMTIIDLSHATDMNPGTVKRHLDDLLQYNLVFISRERLNEYGIMMKYYRASAKSFIFQIKWPK